MAIMEIARLEVKATTTFSFPDVYTALHDFMFEHGYCNDHDAGFPEKFYSESRTQTKGKEIWVWWRFKKKHTGASSPYVNILIDLDIHGVGIRDIEIMYQDRKLQLNKGKIEIIIRGKFEVDPEDKLKKGFFGGYMDAFINRYWRKELLGYRQDVVDELNKIRSFSAQLLNKPPSVVSEEPFDPKLGYLRDNF
jgi:hypothetical protein